MWSRGKRYSLEDRSIRRREIVFGEKKRRPKTLDLSPFARKGTVPIFTDTKIGTVPSLLLYRLQLDRVEGDFAHCAEQADAHDGLAGLRRAR